MPRGSQQTNILPSLLDRLLDDEPGLSKEPADRRFQNLRELESAVARDVEALLNTRQESLEELPEFTEISRSLINYGLPDFTSFSLLNQDDRSRIRRAVEQAIAAFEPRLERVRVSLETPRENDRGLRFRIEALLKVDPAPEPVSFDALLQLHNQQYVVKGQG
ncbi:MAG: type VI secretion system baseplate subunit TssE [Deltaproteobacteria bacterium]|nr:type VI secretion system baseplate subunit TssE [Deltaproteobacteria bacterium]